MTPSLPPTPAPSSCPRATRPASFGLWRSFGLWSLTSFRLLLLGRILDLRVRKLKGKLYDEPGTFSLFRLEPQLAVHVLDYSRYNSKAEAQGGLVALSRQIIGFWDYCILQHDCGLIYQEHSV